MDRNYTKAINIDGKTMLVAIIPELRKDGMYYEINIKGYPRFFMTWSQLDRFDIVGYEKSKIPYEIVLAVSDAIEADKS